MEATIAALATAATLYYMVAFSAFMIAAVWALFLKAGEQGWASLIPFYNVLVLLRIVGRPGWWLLLFIIPIPFLAMVIGIVVMIDLARSFGRGVGYGLGLSFISPIFFPMLAFGNDAYAGPSVQAS